MKRLAMAAVLAGSGIASADPDDCCDRFGNWSVVTKFPAISMGWIAMARSHRLSPTTMPIARGEVLERSDSDSEMLIGPGVRLTVGFLDAWYGGFEVSSGFSNATPHPVLAAIDVVVGARTWLGQSTLSLEAAPGAFVVVSRTGDEQGLALDLRVRADCWLSPWFTIGGFVGADPFSHDVSAGALLAFHLRAFDRSSP